MKESCFAALLPGYCSLARRYRGSLGRPSVTPLQHSYNILAATNMEHTKLEPYIWLLMPFKTKYPNDSLIFSIFLCT